MDYYGLPTGSISNPFLRLDYLAQGGPRLVRLVRAGTEINLLAEAPQTHWETPYGEYHLWGGHRLWHAPEDFPRSSIPDDDSLQIETLPDGVRLVGGLEVSTGMRKTIEVRLLPDQPCLTLCHMLVNEGLWPIEVAPWAITALPAGGVAIIPHRAPGKGGHQPDRHVALWPDTHWDDPRFHIYDDALLAEGAPGQPPGKIGLRTYQGWLAYAWNDSLLIKRFDANLPGPYPDKNCNVEIYTGASYIELETLAPLVTLEPGQSTRHKETWEVHPWLSKQLSLGEIVQMAYQTAEEYGFSC
jgi:hypothetical protein